MMSLFCPFHIWLNWNFTKLYNSVNGGQCCCRMDDVEFINEPNQRLLRRLGSNTSTNSSSNSDSSTDQLDSATSSNLDGSNDFHRRSYRGWVRFSANIRMPSSTLPMLLSVLVRFCSHLDDVVFASTVHFLWIMYMNMIYRLMHLF